MEKRRELLELASRLAEFGDPGTIKKVEQIAANVAKKRLSTEAWQPEFLKMLSLYFYQVDILGGGNATKKRLKDFIAGWLKVKCPKGQEPLWENAEMRVLTLDELRYVLGWAGRAAREKGSGFENRPIRQQTAPSNLVINVAKKAETVNISSLPMEEQLKRLIEKFNK